MRRTSRKRYEILTCQKQQNLVRVIVLSLIMNIVLLSSLARANNDTIKIAGIFSLSGKAMHSNAPAVLGVKLAAQELNEQGGILGKGVEILFFDNESTPIGSHIAAIKAVDAGVAAIVGAVWSSHSLAIAKIAQKNKIPMISPISTVPSLTRLGDFIFRASYNDNLQGSALAKFARYDLKAGSAIIFTDITSDFSLNISKIFSAVFASKGGSIERVVEYKAGQPNYNKEVKKASDKKADIVFLSGHDESGLIAKLLKESGSSAIPIGSDGWGSKSFFTNGGDQIVQGYYIDHWTPFVQETKSKAFIHKYGQYSPIMPSTPLAYDSLMLLAQAIDDAKTVSGPLIRDSLNNIEKYAGVTGDIFFDHQGDAQKSACIIRIDRGSSSLVKCVDNLQ